MYGFWGDGQDSRSEFLVSMCAVVLSAHSLAVRACGLLAVLLLVGGGRILGRLRQEVQDQECRQAIGRGVQGLRLWVVGHAVPARDVGGAAAQLACARRQVGPKAQWW